MNEIICQICKHEVKNLCGLQMHIKKSHYNEITTQDYYDKYVKQENKNCPVCGNLRFFKGFTEGYATTCKNRKCVSVLANQSKKIEKVKVIQKEIVFEECDTIKSFLIKMLKNTNPKGIFRYMLFKHKNIHDQVVKLQNEKNLSTYNEAIYWIINDMIEKPVCPSYSNKCTKILKFQTVELGYQKSCQKCCVLTPEYKEKIQKTYDKKYNGLHPMKCEWIIEKLSNTTFKNYGVNWPMQSKEIQQKSQNTLHKHYGEIGLSHPDIIKKRTATCLKKYGVEHYLECEEIHRKRIETCIEKYGTNNWMKTDEANKIFKEIWEYKKIEFVKKAKKFLKTINLELISEYNNALDYVTVKCLKCNKEFTAIWNNIQQDINRCPYCYPKIATRAEFEIIEFLNSLDITDIIHHDRKIIKPLELDIVIPTLKIAIEYCGLWCHSSGGNVPNVVDKKYHLNKLELCEKQKYRLITIFEDEWHYRKNIVLSRISNIIGSSKDKIIYARNCEIKEISYQEKNSFINENHIQGDSISSINLGAFFNNELISVMTFSKPNISKGSKNQTDNIWELGRFCNKSENRIIGIAGKLLEFFKRNYQWNIIFSYCDRRWSNGNLYEKIGFKLDSITKPNYWYWGHGLKGRIHRFNFRKNNLKKMKNYDSNLTEFEIMSLEKYAWIYDCGNLKYILKNE